MAPATMKELLLALPAVRKAEISITNNNTAMCLFACNNQRNTEQWSIQE